MPACSDITGMMIYFAGLHMGLAQNIESSPVTSGQTSSEFQSMSQGLSSFPSESCPASTGLLATSASELNLAATDEVCKSEVNQSTLSALKFPFVT